MASINATTSSGIVATADNTGTLQLQSAGTTAINIDESQRAAFVAGTAALPAITTSGDTNTGMFFPAADTIAFSEGGTESMRIDSSGNLIVGDTVQSGSSKLTLKQSVDATNGGLAFVATDGNGAVISRLTDGGFTFRNGGLERMRIDTSGNLLINKTALPSAISTATNLLYIENATGDGQIILNNTRGLGSQFMEQFWRQGTLVGSIQATLSATTYVTSSDYRLKDNIAPMTGALDKLAQLKPVTYKWKQDGSDGQGFIAHELQEHFPDAVVGEKDDVDEKGNIKPQGIDTSFLVATLTAAIQEQQTIINDLKARIEVLEAK